MHICYPLKTNTQLLTSTENPTEMTPPTKQTEVNAAVVGGLKIDYDNVKLNKDKDHPTSYYPVVDSDGKPFQVVFMNQPLGYSTKPASEKSGKMQIAFKSLNSEDFLNTALNKTTSSVKSKLLTENDKFARSLDLVANRYEFLAAELKTKLDADDIPVTDTTIHSFRQSERKFNPKVDDKKNMNKKTKMIPLEAPIYRIQLNACKTGQYGYIGRNDKFVPIVKEIVQNKVIPFTGLANGLMELASRMSIVSGVAQLESICVSSQGLSPVFRIRELYVRHVELSVASRINVAELDYDYPMEEEIELEYEADDEGTNVADGDAE